MHVIFLRIYPFREKAFAVLAFCAEITRDPSLACVLQTHTGTSNMLQINKKREKVQVG
jgi:hypothetical protein